VSRLLVGANPRDGANRHLAVAHKIEAGADWYIELSPAGNAP
jgi:hypothetical protein